MKLFFAHSRHYNFDLELYQPLRSSALSSEHEITLPHENLTQKKSKDLIKDCDLFFADVSYPGTGLGIEIGWADAFNRPIACIYKKDSVVSNSLKYVTNTFIAYDDSQDMISKISAHLASHL